MPNSSFAFNIYGLLLFKISYKFNCKSYARAIAWNYNVNRFFFLLYSLGCPYLEKKVIYDCILNETSSLKK